MIYVIAAWNGKSLRFIFSTMDFPFYTSCLLRQWHSLVNHDFSEISCSSWLAWLKVQAVTTESLKRCQRQNPHCPLWRLLDCSRQRGMAASELLEHSVSCFCQHVTDGQFTYVFHTSRECLRTAFFKSLHCPSASSSQPKAWAKQRLPHYVLATSRVDKACELVLSGRVPFGSSLGRAQGGKGQHRSRPGRFTRQWGDKYLNSVKGHGFCLQSLKNPKISYTNMKSSIFSWKIRSCTIGPTF